MKFRNIGDVLLVSPLLSNLKHHYPNSIIDVAVNKGTESMIDQNPLVNRVVTYDRTQIKSLPFFKQIQNELSFILHFRKQHCDIPSSTV